MFKKLFNHKKSIKCEICKKKIKINDNNSIINQCKKCQERNSVPFISPVLIPINESNDLPNDLQTNKNEIQKPLSLCHGCQWPILSEKNTFKDSEMNVLWHNGCYEIKKILGIIIPIDCYDNIEAINKEKLSKNWSKYTVKLSKILIAFLCDCDYYAFEIASCIKNKDFNSSTLKELIANIIQLTNFLLIISNSFNNNINENKEFNQKNELHELLKNIIIFRKSVEKNIIYTDNVKILVRYLSQIHEIIKKDLSFNINMIFTSSNVDLGFKNIHEFIMRFEEFGYKSINCLTPIYNIQNKNCKYNSEWDDDNKNINVNGNDSLIHYYLNEQINNEIDNLKSNSEVIKLIYLLKEKKSITNDSSNAVITKEKKSLTNDFNNVAIAKEKKSIKDDSNNVVNAEEKNSTNDSNSVVIIKEKKSLANDSNDVFIANKNSEIKVNKKYTPKNDNNNNNNSNKLNMNESNNISITEIPIKSKTISSGSMSVSSKIHSENFNRTIEIQDKNNIINNKNQIHNETIREGNDNKVNIFNDFKQTKNQDNNYNLIKSSVDSILFKNKHRIEENNNQITIDKNNDDYNDKGKNRDDNKERHGFEKHNSNSTIKDNNIKKVDELLNKMQKFVGESALSTKNSNDTIMNNNNNNSNNITLLQNYIRNLEDEKKNSLKLRKSNSFYNKKELKDEEENLKYERSFYSLNNLNPYSSESNLEFIEHEASPSYSMGKPDFNIINKKSMDLSFDNLKYSMYPNKDSNEPNNLNENLSTVSGTSNSNINIIKALSSSLKKGYFSSETYLKYNRDSISNLNLENDYNPYHVKSNRKNRSYSNNSEWSYENGNFENITTSTKLLNLQFNHEMKKAEDIVDESFERGSVYSNSINSNVDNIKNSLLKLRALFNKETNMNSNVINKTNNSVNSVSVENKRNINKSNSIYNKEFNKSSSSINSSTINLSQDLIYINKKLNEFNNQKKKYYSDNRSSISSDTNSTINTDIFSKINNISDINSQYNNTSYSKSNNIDHVTTNNKENNDIISIKSNKNLKSIHKKNGNDFNNNSLINNNEILKTTTKVANNQNNTYNNIINANISKTNNKTIEDSNQINENIIKSSTINNSSKSINCERNTSNIIDNSLLKSYTSTNNNNKVSTNTTNGINKTNINSILKNKINTNTNSNSSNNNKIIINSANSINKANTSTVSTNNTNKANTSTVSINNTNKANTSTVSTNSINKTNTYMVSTNNINRINTNTISTNNINTNDNSSSKSNNNKIISNSIKIPQNNDTKNNIKINNSKNNNNSVIISNNKNIIDNNQNSNNNDKNSKNDNISTNNIKNVVSQSGNLNEITPKGILSLPMKNNIKSSLILPSKEELMIKNNEDSECKSCPIYNDLLL